MGLKREWEEEERKVERCEEGKPPGLFYEVGIILIGEPNKDSSRK